MELYKVANEVQACLANLYDPDNFEVNQDVLTKLTALQKPFEEKCVAVAFFLKNLEVETLAIAEAKKEMSKREVANKRQLESLKEYLLYNMTASEFKEIKCPYFVIKVKKNAKSTNIIDPGLIPLEYKKITLTLDVEKMRSDMLNGVVIPGAELVQKTRVEIK